MTRSTRLKRPRLAAWAGYAAGAREPSQGAYELESLDTVPGIRRLLEIALLDTVGLENSVARNRTVIAGVLAAAKLLEVGEQEERLAAIEAALGPRVVRPESRRR
jgi:hypothetical protein